MIEIEFSMIPDSEQDTEIISKMLDDFRSRNQINVQVHKMTWGEAWPVLLTTASHGKGPDVSHIGSTWVSSLVIMNALRPFNAMEVAATGGSQAFVAPAWQGGIVEGDTRIWSMPWTSYFYVICYRKDLLQKAGIEENAAFSKLESLLGTVRSLHSLDVVYPWLMPYIPSPYNDLLHTAASWIWDAGGDFLSHDAKHTVFNQPLSRAGLKGFIELHRAVPEKAVSFENQKCIDMFLQKQAAAILVDVRDAHELLKGSDVKLRSNIGITVLSSVPWFGSSNLVVWRHVQGYPERERAALSLINFLTGHRAQTMLAQNSSAVPARLDAISEIFPSGHPLANTLTQTSRSGRQYRSVALWHRIEFQLSFALGEMLIDACADRAIDGEDLITKHIDPLATRLDLILSDR
jgi:ABC-type glycerol-3-phosphate transport system substrate-binding protein